MISNNNMKIIMLKMKKVYIIMKMNLKTKNFKKVKKKNSIMKIMMKIIKNNNQNWK